MDDATLASLYEQGLSLREVAVRAGIHKKTVARRLRKAGVPIRGWAALSPLPDDAVCARVIKEFVADVPLRAIQAEHHFAEHTLDRILCKYDKPKLVAARAAKKPKPKPRHKPRRVHHRDTRPRCIRCGMLSQNELCEMCREELAAGIRHQDGELDSELLKTYGYEEVVVKTW